MVIKYEEWVPGHRERVVEPGDLESTYRRASGASSPTFTWNDLGDDLVIVSVGDDYSIVSMMTDDTWFYLRGSGPDEAMAVTMAGQEATVPGSAVLERAQGLEVLKQVDDFARLRSEHSWMEQ